MSGSKLEDFLRRWLRREASDALPSSLSGAAASATSIRTDRRRVVGTPGAAAIGLVAVLAIAVVFSLSRSPTGTTAGAASPSIPRSASLGPMSFTLPPVVGTFVQVAGQAADTAALAVGPDRQLFVATGYGQASQGPCGTGFVGALVGSSLAWTPVPGSVEAVDSSGSVLVAVGRNAGCSPASFRSIDGGASWTSSLQQPDFRPDAVTQTATGRWLASSARGFWTSPDGVTWDSGRQSIGRIGRSASGILFGLLGDTLVMSSDDGLSWSAVAGVTMPASPSMMAFGVQAAIMGTDAGAVVVDLLRSGSTRRLSNGRVLAVAAGSGLLAAIEVDVDGLRLVLATDDGAATSTRIVPPGPGAAVGLLARLAVVGSRVVLVLGNPTEAERIVVSAAPLP